MIISTCNRVEILSCVEQYAEGIDTIESFLSELQCGIPLPQLQPKLYRYSDEQAVRHLFRVASSLDSMILGEPQILGQINPASTQPPMRKTVGTYLNNLLHGVFPDREGECARKRASESIRFLGQFGRCGSWCEKFLAICKKRAF